MADKHRSRIWDHFRKYAAQSVMCRYCNKVIRYYGSTSNLIKHMERVHSCVDFGEEYDKEIIIADPTSDDIIKIEEDEVIESYETEAVKVENQNFMEIPYETQEFTLPTTKVQTVESSCRICLCDLVQINHVGLKDFVKNYEDVTYFEIFKECTGFDVLEREPHHLCAECCLSLVEAYELRIKCKETQKLLDELFTKEKYESHESQEIDEDKNFVTKQNDDEIEEMIIEEIIEEEIKNEEDDVTEIEVVEDLGEVELVPVQITEDIEVQDQRKTSSISKRSDNIPKPVFEECAEEEEISCEQCDSIYKSVRALRCHYKAVHPDLLIHSCPFCEKLFFPQLLEIHTTHCSKRHLVVRQLCPICGEEASRNHIYRHIARAKAIDKTTGRIIEKPYECDICHARATTKNGIAIHIKAIHLNLKIKCDHCDVQVKSRSILTTHIRKFHPHIKDLLKCEYCDFQTASAASLIRHRAAHFGNRPHKCEVCAKEFVTKDAWRVHIATHSDERPFPCEVCDSPFKTKKALGAHMKTHKAHEYECPVCNKSYLTNQQMRNHVTRNHPDFELPPPGTILNKSWHKKKTEFELKVIATQQKRSQEVLDSSQSSNMRQDVF